MGRYAQSHIWRTGIIISALAVLLLAGCGNSTAPSPTPAIEPTIKPEPTATVAPATELSEIVWSNSLTAEGAPGDPLDAFWRGNDVIHASVLASNLVAGETFAATWSINGAPIEAIDTTVEIANDAPTGWIVFSLTWDGAALWPTGALAVIITTNTGVSATGSIQIVSGQ